MTRSDSPPSPAPSSSSATLISLSLPESKLLTLRDRRHLPSSFSLSFPPSQTTKAPLGLNLPRRAARLRKEELEASSPVSVDGMLQSVSSSPAEPSIYAIERWVVDTGTVERFDDIESMFTSPKTGLVEGLDWQERFGLLEGIETLQLKEKEVEPSPSMTRSISETFEELHISTPPRVYGTSTGPVHGALPRRVRKARPVKEVVDDDSDTE